MIIALAVIYKKKDGARSRDPEENQNEDREGGAPVINNNDDVGINDQNNNQAQPVSVANNPVFNLLNDDNNNIRPPNYQTIVYAEAPLAAMPEEPAYAHADGSSSAPHVYMEPMTLNPNHDSGNATHYNVVAIPRNSYPLGVIKTSSEIEENNEGEDVEEFDI